MFFYVNYDISRCYLPVLKLENNRKAEDYSALKGLRLRLNTGCNDINDSRGPSGFPLSTVAVVDENLKTFRSLFRVPARSAESADDADFPAGVARL